MSNISAYGAVDLGALAAARKAQEEAAARAAKRATAAPGTPQVVVDVTDATFEQEVIARSLTVPVVLDLWASWCGPCKQLSPLLERLAEAARGQGEDAEGHHQQRDERLDEGEAGRGPPRSARARVHGHVSCR